MNSSNAKPGTLSHASTALIARHAQLGQYEDGEVIHQRGDRAAGLSLVLSGAVRLGNYGRDGRYFLSAQLEPGQSFGEVTVFAALPRTHSAEAVGDTRIAQLSAGQTAALLAAHPELALDLLSTLSARLHRCLETLDDSKRLPLSVRTAKAIAHNDPLHSNAIIPISQEQLAAEIGVSRMSLSKALSALECQGLIIRRYKMLQIIDRQKLQHWIEEHSQTLNI